MNTMSFFWSRGVEDQKDYFEEFSNTIPKNKLDDLTQDMRDVLCYDLGIRVDTYKYCNICSFYRLDVNSGYLSPNQYEVNYVNRLEKYTKKVS